MDGLKFINMLFSSESIYRKAVQHPLFSLLGHSIFYLLVF